MKKTMTLILTLMMILALLISGCARGNMVVNLGGSPVMCCEQDTEIEETEPDNQP